MFLAGQLLPDSIKQTKLAKFAYNIFDEYITLLPLKLYYGKVAVKNKTGKRILCYPDKPAYNHTLYNICRFKGYTVTNKLQEADCVISFQDTTYRKVDHIMRALHRKYGMINYDCRDISKKKVDAIHKKVFGYGVNIHPLKFRGKYVKKGDLNSTHDGIILAQPEKPEKGYVYQRLVDNVTNGLACDIRLPIFKDTIPFGYLKYRPDRLRFSDDYTTVKIVKTEKIISRQEYKNIIGLCREMGLDYGELDALRDSTSGKLYIVDVNNTPVGPSYFLPFKKKLQALRLLSDAFSSAFLSFFTILTVNLQNFQYIVQFEF